MMFIENHIKAYQRSIIKSPQFKIHQDFHNSKDPLCSHFKIAAPAGNLLVSIMTNFCAIMLLAANTRHISQDTYHL